MWFASVCNVSQGSGGAVCRGLYEWRVIQPERIPARLPSRRGSNLGGIADFDSCIICIRSL